jgi:TolA-binding protein
MTMNRLLLAVFFGLMIASSSWGSSTEPLSSQTSPSNSQKPAQGTTGTSAEKLKKEREAFIRKSQDELGDLNRHIAELRRMARKKTGEARITINQEIRLLEDDRKAAEQKLARLRVEIGEKWDELKSEVTDAIEQLKKSVEKTRADMSEKKEDASH